MASKHLLPRAPAPLLATVAAVALVYGLGLETRGVAVVGELPAGLPGLSWPQLDSESLKLLLGGALGVALVSFSSSMVTARVLPHETAMTSTLTRSSSRWAPVRSPPACRRGSP